MITIRRYSNTTEAAIAKACLESAGIEVSLLDEGAAALGPPFAPWGMRLQVRPEDVEEAMRILEQTDSLPSDVLQETADLRLTPSTQADDTHPAGRRQTLTCPVCKALWELDDAEASRSSFQCPDCGAETDLQSSLAIEPASQDRSWLHAFVPDGKSEWVFILAMVAYARTIQSWVASITQPLTGPVSYYGHVIGWLAVLKTGGSTLIFTPIWESAIFIAALETLRLIGLPLFVRVIIPASIICCIDGQHWWPHGLDVSPFFLISALSYWYWRPVSVLKAGYIILMMHAVSNCLSFTGVVFKQVARENAAAKATGFANRWDQADEQYHTGYGFFEKGDATEAVEKFRQAVALYPYDPLYEEALGAAYKKQDRLTEAESSFRAAVDLNKEYWEAWESLSVVLYNEQRFAQALDATHRARIAAPAYALPRIDGWIMAISAKMTGTSG